MTATTLEPTATEAPLTFADYPLHPETLKALTGMGIETPTPIQQQALPVLINGRDVIGQARTGSGKTLAFAIPAVEIVDPTRRDIQVLVLTPTRELAVQVAEVFDAIAKPRGIKTGLLFGGRAIGPQRIMLKEGIQVLVGTPGRVLDLLNQGALWLDKVRYLVLDEADEMLDRGFAPDVERILSRTTSARQTALFSATVPEWVRKTADRHLNDPVSVVIDTRPEDVPAIEHVAYDLNGEDKLTALRDLLDHRGEGSIIVFGRTKHGVKKLARQLIAAGYPVAALQGNLSQNARDQVMAEFRSGEVKILLATNVAARGLDITHVEQVINMELPESPELLTHRIGRTGRMGRQGRAITLLGAEDSAKWRQLQRGLTRTIPRVPWQGAHAALSGAEIVAAMDATAIVEPGHGRRRRPRGGRSDAMSTAPENARPHRTHGEAVVAHDLNHQPAAGSRMRGRHNQRRGGSHPARVQFPAECSACGAQTTVPFEPRTDKPVYCRPCYEAMRPDASQRPRNRT